jgi:ferredoxin
MDTDSVETVQSIYFSPTGTTKRILSTIETNTTLQPAPQIDLTLLHQRSAFTGQVEGDLILIGAPVYGGSPPWPMLEPLNKLEGDGGWAVPVAVYGNRSPDTCVEELAKILRNRGFKILAGASFVAEHSIIASNYKIAYGRPDNTDMEIIADFGKKIKEKLISNPSPIHLPDKLKNIITNELVDSFPEDYHHRVIEPLNHLLKRDFTERDCSLCYLCERVCPTDALNIESQEINEILCIWCAACVRICPMGVINFRWVDETPASFQRRDKTFGPRKEPIIYI